MTEELLILYKGLYESGGILYRFGKHQRLIQTYIQKPKLYLQHQFPEYEYSTKSAKPLLKKIKWAIAKIADKTIAA
jgi:hypothetical protein